MRLQLLIISLTLCISKSNQIDSKNFKENFKNVTISGISNTEELNEYLTQNRVVSDRPNAYSPFIYYASSISVTVVNSTLSEIPKYFFNRFKYVENVNMASVGLKNITKEDFQNANSLVKLDLSSNSLNSIEQGVFAGLPNFRELNLANNFLTSITGTFSEVGPNFNKVNLTGNRIETISEDAFSGLDQVELIDLRSNKIRNIEKLKLKSNESFIQILDLSKNLIDEFEFDFNFRIKTLHLGNNQLRNLKTISNVENLDVSKNFLKTLKVEQTVQQINAAGNGLESIDFAVDSNLNSLDLQANKLDQSTIKKILNMSNLQFLDLSNNKVGPLTISIFANLTNLRFLFLDSTEISNIEFGTFSHQLHLRILNLSSNDLMEIDFDKFASLSNLEMINLNGNSLREIKNFEHLKKLWPKFSGMGIMNNDWNCSYLSYIMKWLKHEQIQLEYALPFVLDAPNIKGIGCVDLGEDRTVSQDYSNVKQDVQKVLQKLQEHVKINLPKFINEIKSNMCETPEASKLAFESQSNETVMIVLVSIAACIVIVFYSVKLLMFARAQFRRSYRRHCTQSMDAIFENTS